LGSIGIGYVSRYRYGSWTTYRCNIGSGHCTRGPPVADASTWRHATRHARHRRLAPHSCKRPARPGASETAARRREVISTLGGAGWCGLARPARRGRLRPASKNSFFPGEWEFGWKSRARWGVGRCLLGRACAWPLGVGLDDLGADVASGGSRQPRPKFAWWSSSLSLLDGDVLLHCMAANHCAFNFISGLVFPLLRFPFCYSRDSVIEDNCRLE
jgi:hypothetical protein